MARRYKTFFLPTFHRQVKLVLGFLLVLMLCDRFLPWGEGWWRGALSATLAPISVLMVRLLLQAIVGHRKRGDVGGEWLFLGLAFAYIYLQTDFTTYWNWALTLLLLLASFWGVFWFRLSSFVMVVWCAIAGGVLFS